MLALINRRGIQHSEEHTPPKKQRGAAAEDSEGRGTGNACGTPSGRPNRFSHGCRQEEHKGEGVKRVRKRKVCVKRHLTFAFFSPRVTPGLDGPCYDRMLSAQAARED